MKNISIVCLTVSLLFLGGCSHKAADTKAEKLSYEYPTRILDSHTHFHEETEGEEVQPNSRMTSEFNEAKIVGAVVHLGVEETKRFSKVSPTQNGKLRLKICAAIKPGITPALVEAGLNSKRFHCMKIYLGYVPKWATDPFYTPFYRLAQKYDVPVVFHTGDTYDKMAKVKYADPLQLDEIAVTYPKVTFVMAHMGNPWFASAAEVIYKNDNVYVDTSALMLDDVSTQSEEAVNELIVKPLKWFYLYVENPKKFLFGSDWSLLKVSPYVKAMQKAIPQKDWDAFFYGNTARVFKFD